MTCLRKLKAKDVMHPGVFSIEPDDNLLKAAEIMVKNNVGSIIVVQKGKVIGILTERDIVRLIANGVDFREPVYKYMTKLVSVAFPDDDLELVMQKMIVGHFRHLPVVDEDEKPLGMISIRDILNSIQKISTSN